AGCSANVATSSPVEPIQTEPVVYTCAPSELAAIATPVPATRFVHSVVPGRSVGAEPATPARSRPRTQARVIGIEIRTELMIFSFVHWFFAVELHRRLRAEAAPRRGRARPVTARSRTHSAPRRCARARRERRRSTG